MIIKIFNKSFYSKIFSGSRVWEAPLEADRYRLAGLSIQQNFIFTSLIASSDYGYSPVRKTNQTVANYSVQEIDRIMYSSDITYISLSVG
jgi:hypothetical protein